MLLHNILRVLSYNKRLSIPFKMGAATIVVGNAIAAGLIAIAADASAGAAIKPL